MATKKQIDAMSYEKRMEKLNDIVEQLEDEDLAIDTAIKFYKEGIDYIESMSKSLQVYEQEIIFLKKSSDEVL
ncbi:MAG: exodeoxyribonuclease VII small subunit [Lachnospirales bacterium]